MSSLKNDGEKENKQFNQLELELEWLSETVQCERANKYLCASIRIAALDIENTNCI